MKDSLLVKRLSMAQGAIALLDKNLTEGLILAREYDKKRSVTADDQEQELPQGELEFYGDLLGKGEF